MQDLENVTMDEYLRRTVVENPGVVMVRFTAGWCQPCRSIAPYLDDRVQWVASIDTGAKVQFYSIDIDKNTDLFKALSRPPHKIMQGVPAFLVYDKKDRALLQTMTKHDAVFPDDMVLGGDMNSVERLFVAKVYPVIEIGGGGGSGSGSGSGRQSQLTKKN